MPRSVAITPEEKCFDALMLQLRDLALPALIDVLVAARDVSDLAELSAYLLDLAAHYESAP
ncbi:MAG: hypothetical protein WA199_15985 [Xanthobacteraceae bacterium]